MEEKQFCVSIFIAASGVAKLERNEAGRLTGIDVTFGTTNSRCVGMAFPRTGITAEEEVTVIRAVRDTLLVWLAKTKDSEKEATKTSWPQPKGDA